MRSRGRSPFACIVLAGLAFGTFAAGAQATPGALDPPFSFDGWRLVRSDHDQYGHDVVVDGSGRIVTSGRNGSHIGVFRFLDDGSTDRSFGGGDGRVRIVPPGAHGSVAGELELQADGKIVTAFAAFSREGDFAGVARMSPNGNLDASFGGDGIRRVAAVGEGASDVIVQPDGRILVVGGSNVVRLLDDGRRDRSFSAPGAGLMSIRSADIAPDGSILLFSNPTVRRNGRWWVQRLEPDGSLDGTFGGDGLVSDLWAKPAHASEVFVQQDGRILLVGAVMGPASVTVPDVLAVVRLLPNGSTDPSFGNDGRRAPSSVHGFGVEAAVSDDLLYLGLYRENDNRYARLHLDDGRLDRRFGDAGVVDVAPVAVSQVGGITVDPQGRLVSVGAGRDGATPDERLLLFLSRLLPA